MLLHLQEVLGMGRGVYELKMAMGWRGAGLKFGHTWVPAFVPACAGMAGMEAKPL